MFTFFSDSNGNGNSSGEDRPAADLIDVIGPAPDDNNQNNKMVHMNNHYNDIGNHAIIAATTQCGNYVIFLSLRFYVKSVLRISRS